jgi:hypothetical protein
MRNSKAQLLLRLLHRRPLRDINCAYARVRLRKRLALLRALAAHSSLTSSPMQRPDAKLVKPTVEALQLRESAHWRMA